jgi:hypothetical protein
MKSRMGVVASRTIAHSPKNMSKSIRDRTRRMKAVLACGITPGNFGELLDR